MVRKMNNYKLKEQRGAEQVGSEYILEVIGTESVFKDKRLYLHCIICNFYGEINKLNEHRISTAHRLNFLDVHYPSLAQAIKTRNFTNTNSFSLLLENVFNAIFLLYPNENYNCPQVNQAHYIDNEEEVKKSILSAPRVYKSEDKFAIKMEQFIVNNYAKIEKSPQTASTNVDIEKQIKHATASIEKKYKHIKKCLSKGPRYWELYREFYLSFSYHLAGLEPIRKKSFNYATDEFNAYYLSHLDNQMKLEIEKKKEELENSLQNGLEKVSDEEDDEDFDVKIIETKLETVSVSSECDSDCEEPAAKKQKCEIFVQAIKIAHQLIKKGQEPTIDGIKKACNMG